MKEHRAVFSKGRIWITIGESTMPINCTPGQYQLGMDSYCAGVKIRDAFPTLSLPETVFLLSGYVQNTR